MRKYIQAISKLNNLVLNKLKPDEIDRFSESEIYWADKKDATFINRNIKKGQIYQFEFGKNFVPEMSYEHRGMVIGQSGRLLYVLPIFSYNNSLAEHRNAYHSKDNPTSKSDLYLLKASEFSFLKHDSVLKLNDIRSVSSKRIKYSQCGRIYPNSDFYKDIERIVLKKYFAGFSYEHDKLIEENGRLKTELAKAQEEILKLKKPKNENNDNASYKI